MTAIVVLIVLAVFIMLALAFYLVSEHLFYTSFLRRAQQIKNEAGTFDKGIVTEKDLDHLPLPVAKYMKLSGFTGKPRISNAQFTHSGLFRISREGSFKPIKGKYFLTLKHPSFCWFGTVKTMGIPVSAFDSYYSGTGRMVVKILSFFKVVDDRSPETAFSAFGRCIAEFSMAPSFFLDKERITWTAFDTEKAFCTITDSGITIKAELYFYPEGLLDRIVVQRYYDRGKGRFRVEKFTGQLSVFKEFNGFNIPTVLDGYWNLEEGDLYYVHFIVDEAEFR